MVASKLGSNVTYTITGMDGVSTKGPARQTYILKYMYYIYVGLSREDLFHSSNGFRIAWIGTGDKEI